MRSNTPGTDKLMKAPAAKNTNRMLVRLQVSNGVNTDEAVVYFSENSLDGLDANDGPKMSNGSTSIPEIYTTLETEKFVINGMKTMPLNRPIGLGFVPGSATSFSIKANELSNLPADVKVILKDNITLAETDLTDGISSYQFGSEPTTTDRFSLIFRAQGSTTGINNTEKLNSQVFVNAANQITIIAPEKALYSIYNAVGMQLESGQTTGKLQTAYCKLQTGVYVVRVGNETKRVIVK